MKILRQRTGINFFIFNKETKRIEQSTKTDIIYAKYGGIFNIKKKYKINIDAIDRTLIEIEFFFTLDVA